MELLDIKETLIEIGIKIEALQKDIQDLKVICSRMDNHIDFVEQTYETLRTPLDYVKYYFNKPIKYISSNK